MSLLLNSLTPVLAQAADAAQAAATSTADIPFFEQKALIYAAAFTSIGLSTNMGYSWLRKIPFSWCRILS